MRTITAFYPGFFTYSPKPFIATDGLITCFARPPAFKATRIDVLTPSEQTAEKSDFLFRSRPVIDNPIVRDRGLKLFKDHRSYTIHG